MRYQTQIRLKSKPRPAFVWIMTVRIAASEATFGLAQGLAQNPAQVAQPANAVVLDRVVAVVNNQAILASDVNDEIRLAVLDPAGPASEFSRQSMLWSS